MGKPKTWYTSGIFSTRNLRFGTEGKFLRRLALRAPLVRPRFPGPRVLTGSAALRLPVAPPLNQMPRRSLLISVFVLVLWYNQKR